MLIPDEYAGGWDGRRGGLHAFYGSSRLKSFLLLCGEVEVSEGQMVQNLRSILNKK